MTAKPLPTPLAYHTPTPMVKQHTSAYLLAQKKGGSDAQAAPKVGAAVAPKVGAAVTSVKRRAA